MFQEANDSYRKKLTVLQSSRNLIRKKEWPKSGKEKVAEENLAFFRNGYEVMINVMEKKEVLRAGTYFPA